MLDTLIRILIRPDSLLSAISFNEYMHRKKIDYTQSLNIFKHVTLSVESRLFTYLQCSSNHGLSHVAFSTLKNQLFRRCLKSMIYETISVKYYLCSDVQ